MAISSFTQLDVWKLAHQSALDVYRWTKEFPSDERFGLVSQMRKAAVSIAANIAEGIGRRQPRDKMRFYNMSQGSLEELRYFIIPARDLAYAPAPETLHDALREIGAKLNRLVSSVSRDV